MTALVCAVARQFMCIEGTLSSEFGGDNIHMSYTIQVSCIITTNVSHKQPGEWNNVILVLQVEASALDGMTSPIMLDAFDIIYMKWNIIHEFEWHHQCKLESSM